MTSATDEDAPGASPPKPPLSRLLAAEDWSPRAWLRLLRDLYLVFDRRTLGFTRILIGFLLLMELVHRGAAWMDMYSSVGVLPTPLHLQRPSLWGSYTLFNAFDTPAELRVLWAVMFVPLFCLLIGYRTRLAQILSLAFVTGMNARLGLVENGGYTVNNLLVMWTVFLPLGDRFSVDAMLASMRRRRETTADDLNDRGEPVLPGMDAPHVSAVGAAIFLQLSAIYYFNVVHKTGPNWHNGTAVHYVLYNDRMVTPLVAMARDHIPAFALIFMTRSAIFFETMLPIALLMPLARQWARRAAVFMLNALHLAFGVTFTLGPFAWSCCVFSTLLFTREDWDLAASTMRRARRARVVVFDPGSGGALLVCRVLKRLDRFALLTFRAEEGLALGLAVRRPAAPGALVTRSAALADVLDAIPLGPAVAWIARLPGVRALLDAALGALERGHPSAFLGLEVGPRRDPGPAVIAETPPIPWTVPAAGIAVVGGVIALVWARVDAVMPALGIIAATVAVTATVAVWRVYPVVTTAVLRRVLLGSFRELFILAMLAGAVNQAMVELWVVNRRIKVPQPEALKVLALKLRLTQGWFMFSPNPVMDDGTIVVDAVTVDGRHVDPFTGKEPMFDLLHARSLNLSQMWGDYFNRIQLSANSGYRDAMKEYMLRLPERTGRPEDAIVSGEVYWVHDLNPPWGKTESYNEERSRLFTFDNHGPPPRPWRD
jgi:hypothetical protein